MRFESETGARRYMAEHNWRRVIETVYSARGVRINAVDGTGGPHTCRIDHERAAAGARAGDPPTGTPPAEAHPRGASEGSEPISREQL